MEKTIKFRSLTSHWTNSTFFIMSINLLNLFFLVYLMKYIYLVHYKNTTIPWFSQFCYLNVVYRECNKKIVHDLDVSKNFLFCIYCLLIDLMCNFPFKIYPKINWKILLHTWFLLFSQFCAGMLRDANCFLYGTCHTVYSLPKNNKYLYIWCVAGFGTICTI